MFRDFLGLTSGQRVPASGMRPLTAKAPLPTLFPPGRDNQMKLRPTRTFSICQSQLVSKVAHSGRWLRERTAWSGTHGINLKYPFMRLEYAASRLAAPSIGKVPMHLPSQQQPKQSTRKAHETCRTESQTLLCRLAASQTRTRSKTTPNSKNAGRAEYTTLRVSRKRRKKHPSSSKQNRNQKV